MADVDTHYGVLRVSNTGQDTIGRFPARFGEWGWDDVQFVNSALGDDQRRMFGLGGRREFVSKSFAAMSKWNGHAERAESPLPKAESPFPKTAAEILGRVVQPAALHERAVRAEAALQLAKTKFFEFEQRISEVAGRCTAIDTGIGWRAETFLRG